MRGVDVVSHVAANAAVKNNLKESCKYIQQNLIATQNLLEGTPAVGVRAAERQDIPNKPVRKCGMLDITEDSGLGPLALMPRSAILPR
jgi:dTDP-D-glucose 4,6-dehydratase